MRVAGKLGLAFSYQQYLCLSTVSNQSPLILSNRRAQSDPGSWSDPDYFHTYYLINPSNDNDDHLFDTMILILCCCIGKQPSNLSHVQEKFEDLYLKKKEKGMDYNQIIQKKKAFRNPSIYSKLIDFCSIDELGKSFYISKIQR